MLPTPRKEGHTFGGWYNNKLLRGTKFTELSEGWKGTLYAKWVAVPSGVEDVTTTNEMQVYDVMGRWVGNELPMNQHGVFVVIEGKEKYKVVL